MSLVAAYLWCGALMNIKYNFWYDFKNEKEYWLWVGSASILVLAMQIGVGTYASSMCKWYCGMAMRNMQAVDEAAAGSTYNKAEYWGVLAKDPKEAARPGATGADPLPGAKRVKVTERVCAFTKQSRYQNVLCVF